MEFGSLQEISESEEIRDESIDVPFSQESLNKFDQIMGEGAMESDLDYSKLNKLKLDSIERKKKFEQLFETGDFFKRSKMNEIDSNFIQVYKQPVKTKDVSEQNAEVLQRRELNVEDTLVHDICEVDDYGNIYKRNGTILPNNEYTVNGNRYQTDEYGRKVECDAVPIYTQDGVRNQKEQKESGGEERLEQDDGGHLIARVLGGADGEENLVPMRRTINCSDYKKMENEIAKALQEKKQVTMHLGLQYDGDCKRPSKIKVEYTIDEKKTILELENQENSTELLQSLHANISNGDYEELRAEIEDRKADGIETSITSVKTQYNQNGSIEKITVGVLDEASGEKTYKVYESVQEEQV